MIASLEAALEQGATGWSRRVLASWGAGEVGCGSVAVGDV